MPPFPVWRLGDTQMNQFFPQAVRYMCRRKGVETKGMGNKLWATNHRREDGTDTILPPTVACPHWNDDILKRFDALFSV